MGQLIYAGLYCGIFLVLDHGWIGNTADAHYLYWTALAVAFVIVVLFFLPPTRNALVRLRIFDPWASVEMWLPALALLWYGSSCLLSFVNWQFAPAPPQVVQLRVLDKSYDPGSLFGRYRGRRTHVVRVDWRGEPVHLHVDAAAYASAKPGQSVAVNVTSGLLGLEVIDRTVAHLSAGFWWRGDG